MHCNTTGCHVCMGHHQHRKVNATARSVNCHHMLLCRLPPCTTHRRVTNCLDHPGEVVNKMVKMTYRLMG